MKELTWSKLDSLDIPIKALFTGYLLVIGLGLLMAGGQILLTHGMADGKPGLSVDDVVYSYYGDRSGSKLEMKLNGSMQDKAPHEANLAMIKWAREGAKETEWEPAIKPIVDRYCASCHQHIPGLPDISKLSEMQKVAEIDTGAAWSTLTRVSHIHLFGISFIFFFVGLIFSFASGFNPFIKALIIFVPFGFLILDVMAWWLTKIHPGFAILVMIGGVGYSLASAIMIFTSLYQMWLMPYFAARKLGR